MLFSKVSIWYREFCEGSTALNFAFLRQLSIPEYVWKSCDKIKEITTFDIEEAITPIELLILKFQEMTLEDRDQFPDKTPPFKKHKTSDPKSSNSFLLVAKPKRISNPILQDRATKPDRTPNQHPRKRANLESLARPKDRNRRFHAKKTPSMKTTPGSPVTTESASSPSTAAFQLGCYFSSCISFERTSNLSGSDDIDWMVKSLARYGRVLAIQNHWGQIGPKQKWNGAVVTYRSADDCHLILKRLHAEKFTCLNPVYLPERLKLVGQFEERMLRDHPDQYTKGSTVSISCDRRNKPSSTRKLRQLADLYGQVLSFTSVQSTMWEVTYQYTVEAVAAVMALHGKSYEKARLEAELVMGLKERRLNIMIAGHL